MRVLENITEVAVVAYLPQVKENDIHIELHGDILEISVQANDEFGPKKYSKEMLLPFVPDPRTTKSSLENHILEIKLPKKKTGKAQIATNGRRHGTKAVKKGIQSARARTVLNSDITAAIIR